MSQMRLKVLYPRKFESRDGTSGTSWMQVGRAYMNDKGIDVQLWVAPLPNADGHIRLVLREDDGRPAQPQGGYQGQQGAAQRVNQGWGGQGSGQPAGQGAQAPQGGPQGFQGGGLRPQHRDGLSDGQRAQYGGAAAQQNLDQREPGEDDIPF